MAVASAVRKAGGPPASTAASVFLEEVGHCRQRRAPARRASRHRRRPRSARPPAWRVTRRCSSTMCAFAQGRPGLEPDIRRPSRRPRPRRRPDSVVCRQDGRPVVVGRCRRAGAIGPERVVAAGAPSRRYRRVRARNCGVGLALARGKKANAMSFSPGCGERGVQRHRGQPARGHGLLHPRRRQRVDEGRGVAGEQPVSPAGRSAKYIEASQPRGPCPAWRRGTPGQVDGLGDFREVDGRGAVAPGERGGLRIDHHREGPVDGVERHRPCPAVADRTRAACAWGCPAASRPCAPAADQRHRAMAGFVAPAAVRRGQRCRSGRCSPGDRQLARPAPRRPTAMPAPRRLPPTAASSITRLSRPVVACQPSRAVGEGLAPRLGPAPPHRVTGLRDEPGRVDGRRDSHQVEELLAGRGQRFGQVRLVALGRGDDHHVAAPEPTAAAPRWPPRDRRPPPAPRTRGARGH